MLAALRLLLAAVALYLLYLHGLGDVGLIGPDEPRYASVGREMYFSGDWITPRLWGEPWFEKPPLEYWGIASAYSLGFDDDLAPRVFNAVVGLAFIVLFWAILRREFSAKAAAAGAAILATSVGWIAESRIAVMDLPLTVTFSAAMLFGLSGRFVVAAIFLALAVLAKGLVPLALALPALWLFRYQWRKLALPAIVFLAIVQPWYILMGARHGEAFFNEFFLKHHFSRFTEASLQHVQPVWFFLPVLLAAIFPWTPLIALIRFPVTDRQKFLFLWCVWTFLFFSISRNKLPGYILPALPPLAALMGIALAEAKRPLLWASACGAMLGLASLIGDILPSALAEGIRAAQPNIRYVPLLLVSAAGIIGGLWQGWRAVAAVVVILVPLTAYRIFPILEDRVSTRGFWRETVEPRRNDICAEQLHRAWRYGLNFYSIDPIPDCALESKPLRLMQQGSAPPQVLVAPRTDFRAPAASPDPGAF